MTEHTWLEAALETRFTLGRMGCELCTSGPVTILFRSLPVVERGGDGGGDEDVENRLGLFGLFDEDDPSDSKDLLDDIDAGDPRAGSSLSGLFGASKCSGVLDGVGISRCAMLSAFAGEGLGIK